MMALRSANEYEESEDVAHSVAVHATSFSDTILSTQFEETVRQAIPAITINAHGPESNGCNFHKKILMISYQIDGSKHVNEFGRPTIYDLFLDAEEVPPLLNLVTQDPKTRKIMERGMILTCKRTLANDTLSLKLSTEHSKNFIKRIELLQEEIGLFIARQQKNLRTHAMPSRVKPLTGEEVLELQKIPSHYKFEPRNIPLEDIEPGFLLAALYNNAKTGGFGLCHYKDAIMSPEEGRHILSELKRIEESPFFDTLNGRSLKTDFGRTNGKNTIEFTRFWDYNDLPIVAVIAAAQKGLYRPLTGEDILDTEKDVDRILSPLLQKGDESVENTIQAIKIEAERLLRQDDVLNSKILTTTRKITRNLPNTYTFQNYQLSIRNRIEGDVGDLITPYKPVRLVSDRDNAPS